MYVLPILERIDFLQQDNRSFTVSKVTLKDIAIKTGYTINTVSRALKDKDDISKQTRKLIQNMAREMGYVGNMIAGALRSGSTRTIAVILGDISNPHFAIMTKGIEDVACSKNYSIFILNTDERHDLEEKAIYSALSMKVDGIILCPTQKSKDNIELLKRSGVPFVLIGRHLKDIETDYVVCDDIKGGYLATAHLIERGHRQILLLNGPGYISSAEERGKGYKKALAESGISYDSKLVYEVPVTSGECSLLLQQIITDGIAFSAIFAFSDMIAWEAIYTLDKMGFRVPKDKAVVGFDNIQSRLLFPVPLTTIGTSKGKMSRKAVEILLKRIDKNPKKHLKYVIDTNIVIREST
jgi:LacI family transcriptional regulator